MSKTSVTIVAPKAELKKAKHILAKFPLDPIDLTSGQWNLNREPNAEAGTSRRNQEPELQPLSLRSDKGLQYRGQLEGGTNGRPEKACYFVLMRKDKTKTFTAIPLEWWYSFKKERKNSETTLEEAEQALRDRLKHQQFMAKRDLQRSSLFAEEEEDESERRGNKGKAVSEFDFLSAKGGKRAKPREVDDVLGDDGERLEMELDSLMEMDEERAEGWDHEEDIANDDVAVAVDLDIEKEHADNEASKLESELLKDQRAKEREGILVDDDEDMPDYDADDDEVAERQRERQERLREEQELRKKLKAAGLCDDDEDSSDDERAASVSRPRSRSNTPSVPPSPEQPAAVPSNGDAVGAARGKTSGKRGGSTDGESAGTMPASKKAKTSSRLPSANSSAPGTPSMPSAQPAANGTQAAPPAAQLEMTDKMYAEMRAIITTFLTKNGTLMIPQILKLLQEPSLPWATVPFRDKYIGLFVKIACGKMKYPGLEKFLLTDKRDAANKIIVELDPSATT